jgi:hypothetical protein
MNDQSAVNVDEAINAHDGAPDAIETNDDPTVMSDHPIVENTDDLSTLSQDRDQHKQPLRRDEYRDDFGRCPREQIVLAGLHRNLKKIVYAYESWKLLSRGDVAGRIALHCRRIFVTQFQKHTMSPFFHQSKGKKLRQLSSHP